MDLLFFDCALYKQINDMKIDSYDKFINKMVNKANFSYMTNGEAAVTGVLDFSELGILKMGSEAVVGKNFITGEEYSDGQRGFILATLGAGSLLGKVISKINAGKVSNKEIASVEKNSGVVLSMNGAGEFDNLFKKLTKDVVDDGNEVSKSFKNQQLFGGSEWNSYFKELYSHENVFWASPVDSVNEIIEVPSIIKNMTPNEVAEAAIKDGWNVGPLKQGHLEGVPYEVGGGYAMNKDGYYIQYHPGNGHHGESWYYKVSSPTKGKMPRYGEVKFFYDDGAWRYERITSFK